MRLDFNVLWVDDQLASIESGAESLEHHVLEHGFRLRVAGATSLAEASARVADDVFTDQIDLVLVDFDLGQGATGDTLLPEIRRRMRYKDIVFYSARTTKDLRGYVNTAGVEGVYCANRITLTDTIKGVFDALVKKVLDVDHSRGIVLGATSDIDHVVSHGLRALDPLLGAEQRAAAVAFALERIDQRLERFRAAREEIAAAGTIEALLPHHELFVSVDKLRLLLKACEAHFGSAQKPLRKAIGRYINDVPPERNRLGHVRLVASGSERALRGFDGQQVSAEELRGLRRKLLEFRDDFDALAGLLNLQLD